MEIQISFKTVKFYDKGENIRVIFYKRYFSDVSKEIFRKSGDFYIEKGNLIFYDGNESKIKREILTILESILKYGIINSITGRKTLYVYDGFLPLLGSIYFGFIDRGTNVIEVRPATGCYLNCIFCSIDEGKTSKLLERDIVVELDYLIEYARYLAKYKGGKVQFLLNPFGEAKVYPYLFELIEGLKNIKGVDYVGLVSTLYGYTEDDMRDLKYTGLDYVNVSLHTLDEEKSKILVGDENYDVNTVLNNIAEFNKTGGEITLTPVLLRNYNWEDLKNIVLWAKENINNKWRPIVLPQNFLIHKYGRKPKNTYQERWNVFFDYLKKVERETGVSLSAKLEDLKMILNYKPVKVPFRVGEILKVDFRIEGRRKNEYFTKLRDRTISVYSRNPDFEKIKITHVKDNIIIANALY